ncbi:16S rRNA (cytosine967-C5)-methyltransferase [Chitinophaga sp. CF118]|uniref:RsmB/NOP family class I SAM-dependent RNA methyltransferase n=1 Tax=Chitinophaga sp. CF118 TaxID=1884367 RepID=UPI0008E96E95|nr:RsmB/NOP family class I SAM-dependent RNA methyltransferase [Chitinophaga sp. CF118]SFD10101.1 16S rRNA (cytosine967-C5)-methyltransferase [Chitinophaga sp. CF118]
MTRWENYLSTAEEIILVYDGDVPLHHFLKGFFKQRPYMGSRDRRWVSQLVYHYYRLGHLWKDERQVTERILKGTFLCEFDKNELLQFFRPEWNEKIQLSLGEKLTMLSFDGQPGDIFPFVSLLSKEIDAAAFAYSFFVQPYLFIRTRNNKQAAVMQLLQQAGITFTTSGTDTIILPNSTKIDSIITDKSWYEIQDLSSQKVGALFHPKAGEAWWDCCAASGGKSIMLIDKQPNVKLLVSDVRASIIQNLHQRFKEAGIRGYEDVLLDLTAPVLPATISNRKFDQIIVDAPCTGSGTWARSPENLYYFNEESIDTYQQLQKRIAANVVPLLKQGGSLIYITCSVFSKENEDVVAFLEETTGLTKQEGGIIPGYEGRADSMFAVRLIKA